MIGNTWSTIEVNLNNDLTWKSVADQTHPLFFFSVFFVFNSIIIIHETFHKTKETSHTEQGFNVSIS